MLPMLDRKLDSVSIIIVSQKYDQNRLRLAYEQSHFVKAKFILF